MEKLKQYMTDARLGFNRCAELLDEIPMVNINRHEIKTIFCLLAGCYIVAPAATFILTPPTTLGYIVDILSVALLLVPSALVLRELAKKGREIRTQSLTPE